MATQAGKDLVIQRGNGDGPPETFLTVGGLRSNSFSVKVDEVDITTKSNAPWRQLLAVGTRSMEISGQGMLTDDATIKTMLADHQNGVIRNYRIVSGLGDRYTGPFLITNLERNGEYNGAEQFSITLASAGNIAYVAAP